MISCFQSTTERSEKNIQVVILCVKAYTEEKKEKDKVYEGRIEKGRCRPISSLRKQSIRETHIRTLKL